MSSSVNTLKMLSSSSIEKSDLSSKMDENMNSLNIKGGLVKEKSHADDLNISSLAITEETEEEVNLFNRSSCRSCSSLNSSTEHLLLVFKHPEIFRDLPTEEMAAVQHKLFKLSTCQMLCWKCSGVLTYISGQEENIARHIHDCWSLGISEDLNTPEIRSAFCDIAALAEALASSDVCSESGSEIDDELEDICCGCHLPQEVKSVFLCEPVDNVFEGRAGLVLEFDPKDTLIDLHIYLNGAWFGSPEDLPVTRLAECIKLPTGSKIMHVETELKDFLKTGESAVFKYGSGNWKTSVKITSLGSLDLAPGEDKVLMSNLSLDLVCSGCHLEEGRFILNTKSNFQSRPLAMSSEIMFHPRTFCSHSCLEFYKDRSGQRIPSCALESILGTTATDTFFLPRGIMEDSFDSSRDYSTTDSYSLPIGSRTKKFLGQFLKKSGSMADKSGSSKGSRCSCNHCLNHSCSCSDCETSFTTSSSTSSDSSHNSSSTSSNSSSSSSSLGDKSNRSTSSSSSDTSCSSTNSSSSGSPSIKRSSTSDM